MRYTQIYESGDCSVTKKKLRTIMGKNIRKERLDRCLSIDELSELMDISPGYLSMIERGDRGVTALNLLKLAKILGVSTDCFFCNEVNIASNAITELRNKLTAFTVNFDDEELNFIIMVAKGMYQLHHYQK